MQAKTPLIVTPPQVKVQNHHLEIRPFTVQTIEHELPVASVASDKTHCKPFDLPILEQWVFGYTH